MASADVAEAPAECEDDECDTEVAAEPEAISYPLEVVYCALCTMPPEVPIKEYCEIHY